ncbi:hypothetical protein NQ317_006582, partial [Molorchus minor]
MSPDSLPKFIGALCRTVNVEEYCTSSWKIMKNLLGTDMGHSALFTMCRILQEPALRSDTDLLRGAIFFIHMALWGSMPIINLHCPPSSVLPSFLQLLNRPFENYPADTVPVNESEHCDIKCLVAGLIQVFTNKIHKLPSPYLCVIYRSIDRGPLGSPPPQSPAVTQQPPCTVTTIKAQRSGSNENETGWASRQNSNEKSNNAVSSPLDENKKIADKLEAISTRLQQLATAERAERDMCACWCQGWAEIHVRRPTGNMSWVMRIQNQISYTHSMYEFPLNEISTLFMPSLYVESNSSARPPLRRQDSSEEPPNMMDERGLSGSNGSLSGSPKQSPSRQNSRDSIDEELDCMYDDGTRSRNPVRRTNSSPEMSASWKNPFLYQKPGLEGDDNKNADDDNTKKNKMYSKDMRVSCEAIPEEIAGTSTTPPSSDPQHPQKSYQSSGETTSHHPSLLTCHSYPGGQLNFASIIIQPLAHNTNRVVVKVKDELK